MEIILVRHTTPDIAKGICYGQADISVTASFPEELAVIQNSLGEKIKNTICYSSPLLRCAKLANALHENVIFDDRLKELNFGSWELQNWDHIDKKELNPWMEDFVHTPAKNGESFVNLYKRSISFLKELKHSNIEHALVITHAGVIRSIWSYLHQIPLHNSFDLKLTYGEIMEITI